MKSNASPWKLLVPERVAILDRKSTRLNSSHLVISYAVFCLKKKNTMCCKSPWSENDRPSPPCVKAMRMLRFFMLLLSWVCTDAHGRTQLTTNPGALRNYEPH